MGKLLRKWRSISTRPSVSTLRQLSTCRSISPGPMRHISRGYTSDCSANVTPQTTEERRAISGRDRRQEEEVH